MRFRLAQSKVIRTKKMYPEGFSPKLSKFPLSHSIATRTANAAGFCSYLNSIQNTLPIQKRRHGPQWIQPVAMVTDKVVLSLLSAMGSTWPWVAVQLLDVCMRTRWQCHGLHEEGRKWILMRNQLHFPNLSQSSQSPHKSNKFVCSLISWKIVSKDALAFSVRERSVCVCVCYSHHVLTESKACSHATFLGLRNTECYAVRMKPATAE